MAIRDYAFITGPETSTLPTATTPSASTDVVTKGYIDALNAATLYYSNSVVNSTISASVATGALTVALKSFAGTDPSGSDVVGVSFRSSTATSGLFVQRQVTSALSLTIPANTTLGMPASVAKKLFVYAVDNAGTVALAVSTYKRDESQLHNIIDAAFTGTVTIATPGVWTATAHGLLNNDAVTFSTSGALPTGLVAGTKYFVVNKAADTFQVAATPGGAAINTTGSQSGTHTIHVANGRLVSDAVMSAKAIRLIGQMTITVVTPGTWVAPTVVSSHGKDLSTVEPVYFHYRMENADSSSTTNPINYDGLISDSFSMVTTGATTWAAVLELDGTYTINIGAYSSGAGSVMGVYKNGTLIAAVGGYTAAVYGGGSITLPFSSKDIIDIRTTSGTPTLTVDSASGYPNYLSVIYQHNI